MIQITRILILETQQNRQLTQLMLRVMIFYNKCLVNIKRVEKRDHRFRQIGEYFFQDLVQGIHKEEKLNSAIDSTNPPCNVEGLEVTKVNTEAWRRMSCTANF